MENILADSHYGVKILKLQKCEGSPSEQNRNHHTGNWFASMTLEASDPGS